MADGTGPRTDRKLPALLAAFGSALGLLAYFVADLLAALNSEPTRINFSYAGSDEDFSAALFISNMALAAAAASALAGALLGWWAGLLASRRGWRISRDDAG